MSKTAKELFKKLVHDARKPIYEASLETPRPIMSYGSQRLSWFTTEKKHIGQYAHLTDEYIDKLSDDTLETEMVMFIFNCFQQR